MAKSILKIKKCYYCIKFQAKTILTKFLSLKQTEKQKKCKIESNCKWQANMIPRQLVSWQNLISQSTKKLQNRIVSFNMMVICMFYLKADCPSGITDLVNITKFIISEECTFTSSYMTSCNFKTIFFSSNMSLHNPTLLHDNSFKEMLFF